MTFAESTAARARSGATRARQDVAGGYRWTGGGDTCPVFASVPHVTIRPAPPPPPPPAAAAWGCPAPAGVVAIDPLPPNPPAAALLPPAAATTADAASWPLPPATPVAAP